MKIYHWKIIRRKKMEKKNLSKTLKIEKKPRTKNSYRLVLLGDDTSEIIADVHSSEDTLLLAYFIDKALENNTVDSEDFKNYVAREHEKFPFLIVPKE